MLWHEGETPEQVKEMLKAAKRCGRKGRILYSAFWPYISLELFPIDTWIAKGGKNVL